MGKGPELTKYCFACRKWLMEGGFRSHNSSMAHRSSKRQCQACGSLFPNHQQLKAHEEAYADGACANLKHPGKERKWKEDDDPPPPPPPPAASAST
ncbi:hypothetical protein NL676_021890 [Syzygium grande]|nr:hypothetical protein NL676_021890 [Syzygium grande]